MKHLIIETMVTLHKLLSVNKVNSQMMAFCYFPTSQKHPNFCGIGAVKCLDHSSKMRFLPVTSELEPLSALEHALTTCQSLAGKC